MITISRISPTTSTDHVEIHTPQDFRDNTARITRTKTLDGGVYVGYSGVSDGDRTITIKERITKDQEAALWSIFNDGVAVNVSILDGFYLAAIQSFRANNGEVSMTIYLDTKLS